MKITLDTNVLRDAIDPRRERHYDALKILELAASGNFQLQATTRLSNDVPDDPLKSQLDSIPTILTKRVGSLFRVEYTAIGNADTIASEDDKAESDQIMQLLFPGALRIGKHHPNRICDVDHLIAHRNSGATIFVTNEKALLHHAVEMKTRFGIEIKSTADFLESTTVN